MLRTSCQRELIKEKAPLSQGTHINMETFMSILQDVFVYISTTSQTKPKQQNNFPILTNIKLMVIFFANIILYIFVSSGFCHENLNIKQSLKILCWDGENCGKLVEGLTLNFYIFLSSGFHHQNYNIKTRG